MSAALSQDIDWLGSFDEALARAKVEGRPVLVMPLGQGIGPEGDW